MIINDQYGNKIPDDLVIMPTIEFLNEKGIKLVVNADWYDVYTNDDNTLLRDLPTLAVSAKEIDFTSEYDVEGEVIQVLRVNDCLKRWSIEDGFYHA